MTTNKTTTAGDVLAQAIDMDAALALTAAPRIKNAEDDLRRYREWMDRRKDTVWTHLRRAEEHADADRFYSARAELVTLQRIIEGMLENVDRMHMTRDMLDELTR